MAKVTILGAGGWGLALSLAAHRSGNQVSVWSPFQTEINELNEHRESRRLLPGVKIPDDITVTTDINVADGADITIIATPSLAVRETAARLKKIADCGVIVSVAKGIEYDTLMRLSQVIENELPGRDIVVLSGPSHAEEVARSIETSLVSSSKSQSACELVQNVFANSKLRVYTNDDTAGAELGGALKNVIAIASGFCDGMGLGDNTRAALITRGLTEIARLGVYMGAKENTFAGLTGVGDLIVTCMSEHSRNRRFGRLVGSGMSVEDALKQVGTVEGYYAAKTAHKLCAVYGVNMPIIEQCYNVMYKGVDVKEALKALMTRPQCAETDSGWIK